MKVYVSATFKDLAECRESVHTATRRLGLDDIAMESYVAQSQLPLERCLEDVARCDLYIGLFAWRYGFIPPGHDRSITELEYREAASLGKQCLIFLLDEDAPWPVSQIDRGVAGDRIEGLRRELAERHHVSFFRGPDDLSAKVVSALAILTRDNWPAGTVSGGGRLSVETRERYVARLRQVYARVDLEVLTPPGADYLSVGLTSVFVEPSVYEDAPPEIPREWLQRMRSDDVKP
jgi:Domain of unknown function (DUF4062)